MFPVCVGLSGVTLAEGEGEGGDFPLMYLSLLVTSNSLAISLISLFVCAGGGGGDLFCLEMLSR